MAEHKHAMKQALEALEEVEQTLRKISAFQIYPKYYEAITALRAAIEQAEKQEPVAWIEHEWSGTGLQKLHFERPKPTVRDDVVNPIWIPLYTAPPQREWHGLTDAERELAAWSSSNFLKMAESIEAKLKEKNNG